jgi:hypothetical protein
VSSDSSESELISPASSTPVVKAAGRFALRRRLIRGGLAAGPVLMTVASRPVMAQDCTTSSAHTSLSGSRQVTTASCNGGSPAYWISQTPAQTTKQTSYLMEARGAGQPATTFGSIFTSLYGYGDLSLLQVLQAGHSALDKSGLAAHLVAAVLNAQAGFTPPSVLSVGKAQDIWADYNRLGYFEPTAGVRWDSAQTIDWLKTTMPLVA